MRSILTSASSIVRANQYRLTFVRRYRERESVDAPLSTTLASLLVSPSFHPSSRGSSNTLTAPSSPATHTLLGSNGSTQNSTTVPPTATHDGWTGRRPVRVSGWNARRPPGPESG